MGNGVLKGKPNNDIGLYGNRLWDLKGKAIQ